MASTDIYQDIATRTGGNIYIGVVGPVRTGKSTFIRKAMEHLVLNNIEDPYLRGRTIDELPQASAGKTIMTTEPKFVPENAVAVQINHTHCNIRMVDCVGFMVEGALGQSENDMPRMVNTPWSDQPISFEQAAEIGTRKVIREHATIGVVVTTDGSIGELAREEYLDAERKVIAEMKQTGKPFVVLLNSMFPDGEQAQMIRQSMQEEYGVTVLVKNCGEMGERDVADVLGAVALEFPICCICLDIPGWIPYLEASNPIKKALYASVRDAAGQFSTVRQLGALEQKIAENDLIVAAETEAVDMGTGDITLKIGLQDSLYFDMVSELLGKPISNDGDLMLELRALAGAKQNYDKIKSAFELAKGNGYGIVTPDKEDLTLEAPESYRQGNRFGVKIRASAPTYHIIKADVFSEISPIVGDEEQAGALLRYMKEQYADNKDAIWTYDIFGKSVYDMVGDGLKNKFDRLPDDARCKLQETLSRILNEGSGGLICIIL